MTFSYDKSADVLYITFEALPPGAYQYVENESVYPGRNVAKSRSLKLGPSRSIRSPKNSCILDNEAVAHASSSLIPASIAGATHNERCTGQKL